MRLSYSLKHLKKLTGYNTSADQFFYVIEPFLKENNGLLPHSVHVHKTSITFDARRFIKLGGGGDSFYEYLLKIWLHRGKKDPMFREMYDYAMDGLHSELIQKTVFKGFTYIAEKDVKRIHHQMDHLTCFMAGSLALGAYTNPNGLKSPKAQRDLKTGKALAYTCYQM